jgi:F-type H+-transporting ATPase subunit b
MNFLLLASSLTEFRPALIFWTLVTFAVVFVILRAKAWKPILDLVEEREKQIQSAIDSAKRERAEAERLLLEQKTAIAEARREAAEMLRKSQADLERFREELMARARKEADEARAQASRDIEDQKAKAIAEIRSSSVDLAIEIAEKLIGERLDDTKHRKLAEQFVEGVSKQGQARV